jgi:hypothetical protein
MRAEEIRALATEIEKLAAWLSSPVAPPKW